MTGWLAGSLALNVVLLVIALLLAVETPRRARRARESQRRAEVERDQMAKLAMQHKNRADEQFEVIALANQQTRSWQSIYDKATLAAGNAQAWLFREIEALARAHNSAARMHGFKEHTINPQLHNIIVGYKNDFMDTENVSSQIEGHVRKQRQFEEKLADIASMAPGGDRRNG